MTYDVIRKGSRSNKDIPTICVKMLSEELDVFLSGNKAH